MESAAVPAPGAGRSRGAPAVGDKGLKKNAIGFVSSVVIGVASTAPGYSLAATLGFIAAAVALQSPAILLISFVPMFLVAAGYYYMNKADPDCGTSFSWVTKAMGPQLGWIAGWAIVVADVDRDGQPGPDRRPLHVPALRLELGAASTVAVTAVGVLWIVLMTAIVVIGIELSARTQVGLLAAEIFTLALFAVVALVKVYAGGAPAASIHPEPLLAQPVRAQPQRDLGRDAARRSSSTGAGTRRRRVNEETEDPDEAPGKATVVSTLILLGIYMSSPSPPRPTPASTAWSPTRKTCSARSAPKSSARRSTRS